MNEAKFFHNVYFWCKKENRAQNQAELLKGLEILKGIEGVEDFFVGVPANTDRPVVDNTYDVHLMTSFKDSASHDVYQVHPLHLEFIEKNKHTWQRVNIFDSIS